MTTATISLDVPSVHCNACKLNIEEALEELDGVTRSEVDVTARRVAVDYDPTLVEPTAITAAVEAAGYPVG